MVKPDPVLYWLEELFGNLVGPGSFVALDGNAFDIYGLPNAEPRCGTVIESATDTTTAGNVTHYRLQLDESAIAEFVVSEPAADTPRKQSIVRGAIRFATQAWWPRSEA